MFEVVRWQVMNGERLKEFSAKNMQKYTVTRQSSAAGFELESKFFSVPDQRAQLNIIRK
jgi:hypothetical protein